MIIFIEKILEELVARQQGTTGILANLSDKELGELAKRAGIQCVDVEGNN